MKEIIFLAACVVLAVVPAVFIVYRVYEDGICGRAGLGGVVIAAATILLEAAAGREYDPAPQVVLLIASFAVFAAWHLIRFHLRVRRQQRAAAQRDDPFFYSRGM